MKRVVLSNQILYGLSALSLVILGICISVFRNDQTKSTGNAAASGKAKVYWFIPDGFRADRKDFNIFEWAKNGQMPNLQKMMAEGCRGYSWPVFPGHTPTNFATLMTGVSPVRHGISDGSMRMLGYPLNMVVNGGFSSFAKKLSPIWVQAEKSGYIASLQSVPGSTPPDLFSGNTIKGRWGAWGMDFPAVIFQSAKNEKLLGSIGSNRRVFNLGSDLTKFVSPEPATNWKIENSKSIDYEVNLSNWQSDLFAAVQGGEVFISKDKKNVLAKLHEGEWSQWIPVTLRFEIKNDYQKNTPKKTRLERELSEVEVSSSMKIKIVKIEGQDFRIRILYDNLNEYLTSPANLAKSIRDRIGPMVDFVDNFPPQLIYYPQDKQTFLEEADMSWEWHRSMVPLLTKDLRSDFVIHSIYNPNQMLTSRWWLPFIDRGSYRYQEKNQKEKELLFDEVKAMYKKADDILGEILKSTDSNWYVVLSSDHGVLPLYREVRLNNLFAKKGWLKYRTNPVSHEQEIDWSQTRVVYLQMNNIYINTKSLAGPYQRQSSSEYYKLRREVIDLIESLKDPSTEQKIASHVWTHEQSELAGLPEDRVGDIILANAPQYSWSEDITDDQEIIVGTLKGGYKQGVWPESAEGMLTPFVIVGPNIKKDCVLTEPIHHVDQFATLAKILDLKIPYSSEGRVLNEIFK